MFHKDGLKCQLLDLKFHNLTSYKKSPVKLDENKMIKVK